MRILFLFDVRGRPWSKVVAVLMAPRGSPRGSAGPGRRPWTPSLWTLPQSALSVMIVPALIKPLGGTWP